MRGDEASAILANVFSDDLYLAVLKLTNRRADSPLLQFRSGATDNHEKWLYCISRKKLNPFPRMIGGNMGSKLRAVQRRREAQPPPAAEAASWQREYERLLKETIRHGLRCSRAPE